MSLSNLLNNIAQQNAQQVFCVGFYVFVAAYCFSTLILLGRKPKRLWFCAACVLLLGTYLFWDLFSVNGAQNVAPKLILSVASAVDLFLFKLVTSLGNFKAYFYLSEPVRTNPAVVEMRLVMQTGLYLCAIWTTGLLVINFFARRLVSRLWLWAHNPNDGYHVFLGTDPYCLSVAASLPEALQKNVIFVDFPVREELGDRLTMFHLLRGLRTSKIGSIRRVTPNASILTANIKPKECPGVDFFREMGLARLGRYLANKDSRFYILSKNYEDNIATLQKLPPIDAMVYCHAPADGINARIPYSSGIRVTLVDSSSLAIQNMKKNAEISPIRYVDIARDKDGTPHGWVKGAFNSMIIGFGETGRGALSFLYEYGALVGKNHEPIPFSCEVIDRNASLLEGEFRITHPAIPEKKVSFIQEEAGTRIFWDHLEKRLGNLNYIVIALNNDAEAAHLALSILEKAFKLCPEHLDKMCLVVRLVDTGKYRQMIDYYQDNYKTRCIRLIGDISQSWRFENIDQTANEQAASIFFDAYSAASGEKQSWEQRRDNVLNKTGFSDLWKKMELHRKESQDFSNYWHLSVKKALCPPRYYLDDRFQNCIPSTYAGTHATCEQAKDYDTLEYLAIGEHIRWVAAHEIDGYTHSEKKLEDRKEHSDLIDYAHLSEETRHYDWIVVKTTLELLHNNKLTDV